MIFRETVVRKEFTQDDAHKLVGRCMRYDSEITLEMGTKKINAKSLMGVISMMLKPGNTVTVIAKGDDQEEALENAVKILGAQN